MDIFWKECAAYIIEMNIFKMSAYYEHVTKLLSLELSFAY